MDITGIAVKLDLRSALSPLASCCCSEQLTGSHALFALPDNCSSQQKALLLTSYAYNQSRIKHNSQCNYYYLQKVLITSLDQDLYGDGVNCEDEYVEILDGDTVDALSLGK